MQTKYPHVIGALKESYLNVTMWQNGVEIYECFHTLKLKRSFNKYKTDTYKITFEKRSNHERQVVEAYIQSNEVWLLSSSLSSSSCLCSFSFVIGQLISSL